MPFAWYLHYSTIQKIQGARIQYPDYILTPRLTSKAYGLQDELRVKLSGLYQESKEMCQLL